jgi:Peptidase family C54
MSLPHYIGTLGGQEDKAYYIIGYNETKNKYYYLDPHYINAAVDPDTMETESYTKKTIHEYNYSNMNTSMQISFLIRDNIDFKYFMMLFTSLLDMYGLDNTYISLLETNRFDNYEDGGLVEF